MENLEGNLLNLERRDSKYKQLTKEQPEFGMQHKLNTKKARYVPMFLQKRKKRCGRKPKEYSNKLAQIKNTPLNRQGTPRSLFFAIDIQKSTLFDIFKSGKYIKRISSTVKPTLTDKNKMDRLKFCLSKVNLANNGDLLFDDLYDYVHIDEKWFYLTKVKRSYYLMLNEENPERNCKSKRFITKIMFMAAVARPRYDAHRKLYFDGKIGIWPFVYQEP
ncbi:hypothetical protein CWI38_2100p0010, partial [Hamiltosporidium tvaerminnensis]